MASLVKGGSKQRGEMREVTNGTLPVRSCHHR